MSIVLGLLIANLTALIIILAMLIHAAMQSRYVIPILYKIYIGLIIVIFFLMDSIFALWFLEEGIFSEDNYYVYRYLFETVLGIIGFYLLIEINTHVHKKKSFLQVLILIIGTNFITALLFLYVQYPSIHDNSIGFLFVLNDEVPLSVQIFILINKLFGLGGLISFLGYVCILIVKSRLFSRVSNILLSCGILSIINSLITIPALDVILDLRIEITLGVWFITFLFIIAARLNRINIRVVMDVHDLIITTKNGVPIYSLSDGKVDPDLIAGALSGITQLIKEISGSKGNIRSIDEGDVKFLFAFGNYAFITLIIEGNSLIINKMLEKLLVLFETKYSQILKNWVGDTKVFEPVREIINTIFSQVEWKKPLN